MAIEFSWLLEQLQSVKDRHGALPPILIANAGGAGDALLSSAALSTLGCLGWSQEETLRVDLSQDDPETPRRIRDWPGPVLFAHFDRASTQMLRSCLNGEVLGPLCRPVIAISDLPSAQLPQPLPFAILELP